MCKMKTVFTKFVVICIGLFALTLNAFALEPITYLDENDEEQTITSYKEITGEETLLTRGWYVVKGNVASKVEKVEIRGNVHIILADDCYWFADDRLSFDGTDVYGVLSIYTQSHGNKEGRMKLANENYYGCSLWGLQIYGGRIEIYGDEYDFPAISAYDVALKNCSLIINSCKGIYCDNLLCDGADLSITARRYGVVVKEKLELLSSKSVIKWDIPRLSYSGSQSVVLPEGVAIVVDGEVYTGEVPLYVISQATDVKVDDVTSETVSVDCFGCESPTSKQCEGWFTLDGVRLSGKPTEKGIYIHNGRKVLVK